ncbi:MAG TPA: succinate--CoA ligase subunit alpha, partial [Balneolaceae bacterium]|nr:succinate--CoA ligase subunit alpha [Balneolaceae bacterium]
AEAVKEVQANTSIIFVPPAFAGDAITEAAFAGIEVIICITEGIPVKDMITAKQIVKSHGATLIGPNCPGVITPGEAKIGIMPGNIFTPGKVGLISRSGTLTYEAVDQLTKAGLGQSTAIGIGGDPVIGTTHLDAVKLLNDDPDTEAIVLIGEIGGTAEEEAGEWIKEHCDKPVVAFIAGSTAPPGRRMGHAGAIISGGKGTAQEKKKSLANSGITVVDSPAEIGVTLKNLLENV